MGKNNWLVFKSSDSAVEETHDQERYRKTKVISYDPKWPSIYNEEQNKICNILKDELVAIYHIGSTAIPGIKAKPVIDILVVVNELEKLEHHRKEFESLGYHWMGEYSIQGRRYLWRVANEKIDYHLQCFQSNNENIASCLAFRDYLRAHSNKALEYSVAKEAASKKHPDDAHAYWDEKKEVLETLLQEALHWQKNKL